LRKKEARINLFKSALLEKPTEKQKEHLYMEVNGYSLASHFYWGLWAMIQAMVSDIDFDYMSYAVLRFNEYEKRKAEVLESLY
jgi:ethanolamine kinase